MSIATNFHHLELIPMRLAILFFALSLGWTMPIFGQSSSVTATLSLSAPSPTCTITTVSSLNYGTVEKPGSGTGSVVIHAQTGTRSSSTLSVSGSASAGQTRLSGTNVASYNVSRSFPATLNNSGSSLAYSGAWSQAATSGGTYTLIRGAAYSGTAGGAGTSFNHFFRFGGTVSGITLSKSNGTYTGTITTTAACN